MYSVFTMASRNKSRKKTIFKNAFVFFPSDKKTDIISTKLIENYGESICEGDLVNVHYGNFGLLECRIEKLSGKLIDFMYAYKLLLEILLLKFLLFYLYIR